MTESAELAQLLPRIQQKWQHRLVQSRRYLPPPWWAPGLVVTAETRHWYETYLPYDEFRHDLCRLAVCVLPHPSWTPSLLRIPELKPGTAGSMRTPASIADFWAQLPARFAGRVAFEKDELLPLFCALADPPRYGTSIMRYPEQYKLLQGIYTHSAEDELSFLDLACGVGHGTYEIARLLQECGVRRLTAVGLTREPLEACMATAKSLPHDARREQLLRGVHADAPLLFTAGDLLQPPFRQRFNLILCNGIVGEAFLQQPQQFQALLLQLQQLITADGIVMLANRFHQGKAAQLEVFKRTAAEAGWQTTGAWQNLCCRRIT